ncbi:calcium-binding protein [Polymorphobacter multimanifer]|uniref:Putative lipid-binding transport protein (Tim44 family) n=2 Tax=Polymorphobacter multimanifer TaxID=1070431 RepID=A0A841L577_9SPHN|nr:putative lipid-binding transport protein (Tim44 family) [Polymorphobacter multimanifer]GGI93043.1 calcium-binding protein [Polymorphobacter multimanifer]
MADGSNWVEIVLLAMLAAFIGLRLVSVLGKRTGEEPVPRDDFRPGSPELIARPSRNPESAPRVVAKLPEGTDAALAPRLADLAEQDPAFDPQRFVTNARAAYQMVLEAFWSGNLGSMEGLVSEEIQENFATAVEQRDGKRLSNKIAGIDSATITGVDLVGQMAEITVRFVARVTTPESDTPAETADLWTFSRHITSRDPAWLLIATDVEA